MLTSEAQLAEGDMYQGLSSCLLNHAVDVLEACASLGLNDPALTSAIERFLVSAESAVNRRRWADIFWRKGLLIHPLYLTSLRSPASFLQLSIHCPSYVYYAVACS